MKYYVINYSEQGVGRIFWYSEGHEPESLKTDHGIEDEAWEYFKLGIEEYATYKDVCEVYSFMPRTLFPPDHMYIRWLGS